MLLQEFLNGGRLVWVHTDDEGRNEMLNKLSHTLNTPGFLAGILPALVAWTATIASIATYAR